MRRYSTYYNNILLFKILFLYKLHFYKKMLVNNNKGKKEKKPELFLIALEIR